MSDDTDCLAVAVSVSLGCGVVDVVAGSVLLVVVVVDVVEGPSAVDDELVTADACFGDAEAVPHADAARATTTRSTWSEERRTTTIAKPSGHRRWALSGD